MQSITGFFLLMLFGYSKSSSNTRCFQEYGRSLCFTRADPQVALSWSSAMEWCEDVGGTLPTQSSTLYGNVLSYFGLNTETLWLGANLIYDPANWYWTTGSRFTGTIENSNIPGKTQAYIVRNGTSVKFVAAAPTSSYYSICQITYYSDYQCASYYQDSNWASNKCYVKTKSWYSWNSYRSSCGSPAIIDNLNDFSRWLDDLQPFWIGLRCSWWTWHDAVTGNSYEVFENRFGNVNNLNVNTSQCLASYKDGNGNIYWTNRDCNSNLPFICQYYTNTTDLANTTSRINRNTASEITTSRINATTAIPIYPTSGPKFAPTTTALPMTSATVSRTATRVPAFTSNLTNSTTPSGGDTVSSSTQTATTTSMRNCNNNEWKPVIFGLSMEFFVGLGGGLLLAVLLWLALLTVCACKKRGGTKIYPKETCQGDLSATQRQLQAVPTVTTHSTTHQMIRVMPTHIS